MQILQDPACREWAELLEKGASDGAPVDKSDGFIHFSTADQVAETAERHFAGEDGLILAAFEADDLGARWSGNRRGVARFSRISTGRCARDDVLWHAPCRSKTAACLSGGALGHVGTLRPVGHAPHGPRTRPCAGHGGAEDGMLPLSGPVTSPRLAITLAGLALPNPVGLAAGFDKNAEAIVPLSRTGFGFLEVGGATPRAQDGNAKPRLFRLTEDAAAINRFGFNNDGMEVIADRLARPRDRCPSA
jgi:uncharacterized protein (DUF952 family)